MMIERLLATAAAALLLVAAGTANAEKTIEEASNEACTTKTWDVLELDEGHTTAYWRGDCVVFADDTASPTHLSTADCVGSFEFMPDETYSGGGSCTYTDRDGDKYFIKYWEGSDMEEGRIEYTGGTGKYAGATGKGTYTGQELTDTLSAYRVKGVMELP